MGLLLLRLPLELPGMEQRVNEVLLGLAAVGVILAIGVVAVLILTLCGELLAHWRGEDF